MGEVDVGLLLNAGEVVAWVVVVAGEAVAAAAAVGVDEGGDGGVLADGLQIAAQAGGGVVDDGIGAREEEDFVLIHGPELGVLGDVVEAAAQLAQILQKILADVTEDFPQRLAGFQALHFGKAAQDGDVDGRGELAHDAALHAEPLGGDIGAAGVEPLGRLQPVAELARILIHAEVLQHEAQRADGRMLGRKLVVVKVVPLWRVLAADIDDGNGGIGEVLWRGLAPDDGHAVHGGQQAAGEEFVLMGAAGMGEDEGEGWGHGGSGCLCAGGGVGASGESVSDER